MQYRILIGGCQIVFLSTARAAPSRGPTEYWTLFPAGWFGDEVGDLGSWGKEKTRSPRGNGLGETADTNRPKQLEPRRVRAFRSRRPTPLGGGYWTASPR